MKNLFIEIRGRVVVFVHNGLAYTPDEWVSILALVRRSDLSELRFLVFDDGGTFDSMQRRELIDAMGGRMPMAAVFIRSMVSRGVVTALGWFKPGIKAFDPAHFESAAAYLGLTAEESAFASKMAEQLQAQLRRKSA